MGRLIYSMIVSADGYVADRDGEFSQWAQPDEEVLNEINSDLEDVDVFLCGRRMYEVMSVWETDPEVITQSPNSEVFARSWQAAQKIVYSRSQIEVVTANTRLESSFDPEFVRRLKDREAGGDLTVDGPTLAAEALRCGVVDEVHMLVCPVTVGGGLRFFPDMRIDLSLYSAKSFSNGMAQLKYRVVHA